MEYIAVFALSSNPRNIIANISTRACNLIKCIHCATGMRFKLDEMFTLFLGQQYDTLMNGLTKDEATATCVLYENKRHCIRKNYNFKVQIYAYRANYIVWL